jgi:hypothetical protein
MSACTRMRKTYLKEGTKSKMMVCSGQRFYFSSLRVAGFFLFSLVFSLFCSLVLGSLLSSSVSLY